MAASLVDSLADVISWVAIVIIPIILGIVYWQIHYLPSKIAEKRQHPQQEAIHAMCMVSRFSGGLFWPIAFVWAHLKPAITPLSKDQVSAIAQANKKSEAKDGKDESC
jgi:cytoskeletal protein RodZ